MRDHVSVTQWLALDGDAKRKLSEQFGIGRSGPSEVMNNVQVSDGTTDRDLERLSVGRMIAYLGDELPWYAEELERELLTMTVDKLYGRTRTAEAALPGTPADPGGLPDAAAGIAVGSEGTGIEGGAEGPKPGGAGGKKRGGPKAA